VYPLLTYKKEIIGAFILFVRNYDDRTEPVVVVKTASACQNIRMKNFISPKEILAVWIT
jgi:hypothetical protein